VLIDTGSSDLWVVSANNPYCQNSGSDAIPSSEQFDCPWTFDPSQSSSFEEEYAQWWLNYLDGTYVRGIFGTDTVSLNDGTTVTGLGMGVGTNSTISRGILGLGYKSLEASGGTSTYDNLPYLLKQQGKVQAAAYSMYLNDMSSQSGTVLFGGVDSKKYIGGLWTVPIVKDPIYNEYTRFFVKVEKISYENGNCNSNSETVLYQNSSYTSVLDTGFTSLTLPTSAYYSLLEDFPGVDFSADGFPMVGCDQSILHNKYITIYLQNNVPIRVNLTQALLPIVNGNGIQATCALAIQQDDEYSVPALGDPFLRSSYVVYDLDNNEVSIGQASYASDSNIEAIGSRVPRAQSASDFTASPTNFCQALPTS
jgi:yapsin 1/2